MVTWSAIIGQFRNAAQGHDSLHTNVLLKGQDGEMMIGLLHVFISHWRVVFGQ